MNNLREKAREIREAGEQERGRFEATGAPLRAYNYWLNNAKPSKTADIRHGVKKENFCHFWRVVAIWAPLLFLVKKVDDASDSPVFWGFIGVVVLAALGVAGAIVDGMWAFLGVMFLTFAGIAVVVGLMIGLHAALDKMSGGKGDDWMAKLLAGIGLVLVAALIVWGVVALGTAIGWVSVLWGALGVLTGVALVFGLVLAGSTIAGYYRAKRRDKPVKEQVFDGKVNKDVFEYEVEKEPSRFQRRLQATLRGLGDFLILIGQVVRVKKWKICPLVDIDTSGKAEV